jgi:predicted secreted acid phosphatase
LVPGAAEFMQQVYNMGGKVALITNREKSLDNATWQNLSKSIPVTFDNTCLTGRTQADKGAINHSDIINDKDLRRQQLTSGNVDCFSTQKKTNSWQSKHSIIMQIGDNIEDIDGITQEHANIDALSKRLNKDIFILLNPMYGSW